MIEDPNVLISFPNYGKEKSAKLFLWDRIRVSEISYKDLSNLQKCIVTVNFSSAASALVMRNKRLPSNVVDLEDLIVWGNKNPKVSEVRNQFDLLRLLEWVGVSENDRLLFASMKYHSDDFDRGVLKNVAKGLLRAFEYLYQLTKSLGEWDRFYDVEVPVTKVLYEALLSGVSFDPNRLHLYREEIDYDFYSALKTFSAKHQMALEVPSESNVIEKLTEEGWDLDKFPLDLLLDYFSLENDFGVDFRELKKLRSTRSALNGISHKKSVSFPEIYVHGTRTSRILLKTPALQNLAKKYRSIIVPKKGNTLSYVDYDQFEIGIMAALSGDPILSKRYAQNDLYLQAAKLLFGDEKRRGDAKRLFLSYAYGMSRKHLRKAGRELGSSADKVNTLFDRFTVFEDWKKDVANQLKSYGRVGTSQGNYFYIDYSHKPKPKDVRSAVSQKVQGTGSLIFKLALQEVSSLKSYRIVLPMHDAVLVEHQANTTADRVVSAFENTMTNFFQGKISGKASISNFAKD